MIRLAVDIHGGDFGPAVVVPAAMSFLERFPDVHMTLFGDTSASQSWQAIGRFAESPRLQWQHATTYPTDQLTVRELVRTVPRDDSLVRMLQEHAAGHSDAVVTAADTRLLLLRSRQILGCQLGLRRPALGAWIPAYTGPVLVLDVGASVTPGVADLLAMARLGHRFLKARQYDRQPSVGLLNIGTEMHKAQQRLAAVGAALAADSALDYRGYVEPQAVFEHQVDLVITDGFTGNIMLKSMEASVGYARSRVADVLTQHWLGRLMGLCLAGLYRKQWHELSPEVHNGAPLLGVNGWVVKSHGRAGITATEHALAAARRQVRSGLPTAMGGAGRSV